MHHRPHIFTKLSACETEECWAALIAAAQESETLEVS
jgi:hypothetical protein